jgi:hypothetical protein
VIGHVQRVPDAELGSQIAKHKHEPKHELERKQRK